MTHEPDIMIISVKRAGKITSYEIHGARVLVGSGAHCEIRLPQGMAAVEQLVIESRQGGVFAEARSLDPMPQLNGSPFTQGRLLPDAVQATALAKMSR